MWGSILAAGANIVGGLIKSKGARDANSAARASVGEQMDFQERMSNSAYQRAMADMRAAGLNPILAYKMGGASTPQGASYAPINELAPLGESFGAAANSAVDTYRASADVNLKRRQADTEQARRILVIGQDALNMTHSDLNRAQAAVARASAKQLEALADQVRAQTGLTKQQLSTEQLRTLIAGVDLAAAKESLKRQEQYGQVYTGDAGSVLAYAEVILGAIGRIFGGSVSYRGN